MANIGEMRLTVQKSMDLGRVITAMSAHDDENGGFGLNNGQETPTGRPLSLSRVKAEVAYSAACCTYTSNRLQIGRATPVQPRRVIADNA